MTFEEPSLQSRWVHFACCEPAHFAFQAFPFVGEHISFAGEDTLFAGKLVLFVGELVHFVGEPVIFADRSQFSLLVSLLLFPG